jgi:hypothetical protein
VNGAWVRRTRRLSFRCPPIAIEHKAFTHVISVTSQLHEGATKTAAFAIDIGDRDQDEYLAVSVVGEFKLRTLINLWPCGLILVSDRTRRAKAREPYIENMNLFIIEGALDHNRTAPVSTSFCTCESRKP